MRKKERRKRELTMAEGWGRDYGRDKKEETRMKKGYKREGHRDETGQGQKA